MPEGYVPTCFSLLQPGKWLDSTKNRPRPNPSQFTSHTGSEIKQSEILSAPLTIERNNKLSKWLVDLKGSLITESRSAFSRTRQLHKLKNETNKRNPTETRNEKTAIGIIDNVGRYMTPL
jgi:hypothetical protein